HAEQFAENPDLSLRQVARAAGISPETARDVRNRLRNGEDLLPRSRQRDREVQSGHERAAETETGADTDTGADTGTEPLPAPRGEPAALRLARPTARARTDATLDRVVLVKRLTADPALRFSETGRSLLRLLAIHAVREEEWNAIIGNVPPHCSGIVADLAVQLADMWADFATRVRQDVTASAG
ncbi:streptomycin biosynthesis regulator, partial [Streptomyces hyaluromycini]